MRYGKWRKVWHQKIWQDRWGGEPVARDEKIMAVERNAGLQISSFIHNGSVTPA